MAVERMRGTAARMGARGHQPRGAGGLIRSFNKRNRERQGEGADVATASTRTAAPRPRGPVVSTVLASSPRARAVFCSRFGGAEGRLLRPGDTGKDAGCREVVQACRHIVRFQGYPAGAAHRVEGPGVLWARAGAPTRCPHRALLPRPAALIWSSWHMECARYRSLAALTVRCVGMPW